MCQLDKIEPYIKMIDKTVRNPRTGGVYMAEFQELIKNFDRIRDYMRQTSESPVRCLEVQKFYRHGPDAPFLPPGPFMGLS